MFLRKNFVGNNYYYRLVKSYRVDGKIKQKTILSLGTKEVAYLKLRDQIEYSHFIENLNYTNKKVYKTIYADPPWLERGGRGANNHYPLMSTKKIEALGMKINEFTDENSHLYLWVTNNFLEDGLKVVKTWGFRYITKITWVKGKKIDNKYFRLNNPGLGRYFRGLDEVCLFCVKGSLPIKKAFQTVLISPRKKHSEKPIEMYNIIQKVSHPPYIELFARKRKKNWDTWGNENLTNDINI